MAIDRFPLGTQTITSEEVLTDPVQRFRISQPQALIDTDFEYGVQSSKWENLAVINNRPFIYTGATPITITAITMANNSRTVTVSLTFTNNLSVGMPIYVQDAFLSVANGGFVIESINAGTNFTYTANAKNTTALTALLDTNKTAIYLGSFYSSAAIGAAPTMTYSGTAITVTTTIPHGLSIGNEIAVTGTTATTFAPNGVFAVARIISATQFVYYADATPTGTLVATSAFVYSFPQGSVLHRPFDGGVIFSANSFSNYSSEIRQTRRYFRYQSGKGVQISSGTLLKPDFQIDSVTYASSLVTVTTKDKHNIQPGSTIIVSGATETEFNGTFTTYSVTGYNTFTYVPAVNPSVAVASGTIYISIGGWYGAVNRLGLFDQQNGVFFEFDGQTANIVRRSSTFQLAGKISVTNGQSTVTQTSVTFPTYFSKQAAVGDWVVIRGVSYRITAMASDTSLTISPSYRGATATNAIMSKTIDTKIPQSSWNIDKMDGTGPSGYNLDLTKMQMFYIDYSWYGAGAIRWGLRATDGKVTYCHKMVNNNVNPESYMRSGNLPARYESTTQPPYTSLAASITNVATTATVVSTAGFPSSGTLLINQGNNYEYVNYTGTTATTFTGLTRGQTGNASLALTVAAGSNTATVGSATNLQRGQRIISADFPEGTFIANIVGTTLTLSQAAAAANPTVIVPAMGTAAGIGITYSATNPTLVELAFPTFSPTISHWGTSVIMDGRYDDDKSLLFTYGQSTATTVAAGATNALIAIRVSPSADNGVGGQFGARELVNRMQLVLRALDVTTLTASTNLLITAVLNGVPSASRTWSRGVGTDSSLAQVADYGGTNTTLTGGDVTGGFFVNTTTSIDLSNVRDLGNSILGGGSTLSNTQIYPDGPDTLHILVRNLSAASAVVFARLSWTEAQA
jgi:hypothetical protein